MVGGGLHVAVNQDGRVLEGDRLAARAPLVGALLAVVHLVEPVTGGGEAAAVEDHADGEVGVVEVEVEGDGPHDDEAGVQVLDLPAHGAAGTGGGAALKRKRRKTQKLIIVRGWYFSQLRDIFIPKLPYPFIMK